MTSFASCTIEKTDYQTELDRETPMDNAIKTAFTLNNEQFTLEVSTLNGKFYKGFNEIQLKVIDHLNNNVLNELEVTFLPVLTGLNDEISTCPHTSILLYDELKESYVGHVIFTSETQINQVWNLQFNFSYDGVESSMDHAFIVEPQANPNRNMLLFQGNDGNQYCLALIAPVQPNVAENTIVAALYRFDSDLYSEISPIPNLPSAYERVVDATLLLDPRMPEPSMGNHSSPNNSDLFQADDGLYYGVVNYTMTGNWTLNFIFKDSEGSVIKGTTVPPDFTPGVDGQKSELHIDIAF